MNTIVQIMNKYNFDEKNFDLLRKIGNDLNSNQRKLAKSLGFSLGKLNYCLMELKKKDLSNLTIFIREKTKLITQDISLHQKE